MKSRKRKKNVKSWKKNVRKLKYQRGLQHINSTGKLVNAKKLKPSCEENCLFKCNSKISIDERNQLFVSYYNSNNSSKRAFIIRTSEKSIKTANTSADSKRKYTFKFFTYLGNEKVRVCHTFYLNTLVISKSVVYNAHKNKNIISGTVAASKSGKHVKKSISNDDKNFVRKHINSFPRIESHYRRSETSKEYLESNLDLSKMYKLYEEKCLKAQKITVKISMYRQIFNFEFNLDFIKPKNDKCDTCERFKIANSNDIEYRNHLQLKEVIRIDRNIDRNCNDKLIICFDLQKVINCPRSNVSSFHYKRKINIYNLTVHESLSKTGYNVIWDESVVGRTGNDIASALVMVLEIIIEKFPQINSFILWSDSCIAQNKNSILTFALAHFIKNHNQITDIVLKYSAPGHSCIQEVDNIHSMIEKSFRKSEYYSLESVKRLIKSANSRKNYEVLEMKKENSKDYYSCAKLLDFKLIPFAFASTSFDK